MRTNGGRTGEEKATSTRPTVVTVDQNGHERRWGQLSRSTAWRVGRFWDDMEGNVVVFLEKAKERKQVQVELRVQRGRQRFWFVETPKQLPRENHEGKGGKKPASREPAEKEAKEDLGDESVTEEEVVESVTEEDPVTEVPTPEMSEVDPEERETGQKMWLINKVTTLENENGELKRAVQEIEAKLALQENVTKQVMERCAVLETAITRIVEHAEQQNVFNESSRSSFEGLVNQVKTHQGYFQEVARILQNHEQNNIKNGSVSEGLAQYVNALFQENEKAKMWVGSLMRDSQAQSEVLRQHHLGQQVLAEVIKEIIG